MLTHQGEWVESWHTLRPNMTPQNAQFAKNEPEFSLLSEMIDEGGGM